MQALIAEARDVGLEKLVSRVFTENAASRKLLARVGFREVGIYERHAKLDGVWRDVVIVELLLKDHSTEPYGSLWQPDLETLEIWRELRPGSTIVIEKLPWEPGRTAYRYPGHVVASTVPDPWIETEAVWTLDTKDVSGLICEPGNVFREFFSPRHPFNCFAMYTPAGDLVGWYGNVTRPTRCYLEDGVLIVSWEDLVIDLVMTVEEKTPRDLDDDELVTSGLSKRDPYLTGQMIEARNHLRRLLQEGFFPTS
jgi:hypothetical protein